MADAKALLAAQVDDLAALADSFTDAQWDSPSLCAGWKVRDVISHMTVGGIYSPLSILTKGPKYRFNIARMSDVFSRDWGATHSGAELAHEFRRVRIDAPKRFSIGSVTPTLEVLVDHITHEQDMRVPLELPRPTPIPDERMRTALDHLPHIGSYGPKRNAEGLRLEVTDYDWAWGSGPLVRGPALALILAVGGRPRGLEALTGDGVEVLRSRIAPAA